MVHYYKKIKKPMCLDMIRRKLMKTSTSPYNSLRDIIRDMFLIFHNACVYNEVSFIHFMVFCISGSIPFIIAQYFVAFLAILFEFII